MSGPSNEEPFVSVVIPTHNRANLLREAIECLWDQTLPADRWEIIIADNCSTDDTPAVVAGLRTRSPVSLHYRRLDRDGGPSCSRNAGAEIANGRNLVFVDSDVRLDPMWLERAVAHAHADPTIGILSGKLVYASRPYIVNVYGGAMSRIGLGWDANEARPADAIVEPADFLWVATAAVLIPRAVFVRLGGFDGDYYCAYEDSDFGWRANLAGYRCRSVPDLLAHHHVGDHRPAYGDPNMTFHSCKNRLRSLLKNYNLTRLSVYLPIYLLYTCTDFLLRRPRWPKIRALWWNVRSLAATLRLRGAVQATRVRPDKELDVLFSRGWFPEEKLDARNRRHSELFAGGSVDTCESSR